MLSDWHYNVVPFKFKTVTTQTALLKPDEALIASVMAYENPLFVARYCVTEKVDEATAYRHFKELKKFLIVCSMNTANDRVTPSRALDEVWHNFLLHTRDYQDFCQDHFGRMIHHKPTIVSNEADALTMMNGYQSALTKAQVFFNYDLDAEMWPLKPEKLIADSGTSSFVCSDYGGNC